MTHRFSQLRCVVILAVVAVLFAQTAHVAWADSTASADSDATRCIVTDCVACSPSSPLLCEVCNAGYEVTSEYLCVAGFSVSSSTTTTTTTAPTTEAPTPEGCLVEGCAQCNAHDANYCVRCLSGYQLTGAFDCSEMAADSAPLPVPAVAAAAAALVMCVAVQLAA